MCADFLLQKTPSNTWGFYLFGYSCERFAFTAEGTKIIPKEARSIKIAEIGVPVRGSSVEAPRTSGCLYGRPVESPNTRPSSSSRDPLERDPPPPPPLASSHSGT